MTEFGRFSSFSVLSRHRLQVAVLALHHVGVLRTAGLRKGKSDKVIRRDRGEERLGRRGAGYLPPPPEVTPHPVPLADGVDHDQPYLAMASDDQRLLSIVCPSYSIDSVGTPQSPLSDSKFIAMLQPCR